MQHSVGNSLLFNIQLHIHPIQQYESSRSCFIYNINKLGETFKLWLRILSIFSKQQLRGSRLTFQDTFNKHFICSAAINTAYVAVHTEHGWHATSWRLQFGVDVFFFCWDLVHLISEIMISNSILWILLTTITLILSHIHCLYVCDWPHHAAVVNNVLMCNMCFMSACPHVHKIEYAD